MSEVDPSIFGDIKEFVTICYKKKKYDVPKGVSILRALQYAGFELDYSKICWNGDCLDCRIEYVSEGEKPLKRLACQVSIEQNIEIVCLPEAVVAR